MPRPSNLLPPASDHYDGRKFFYPNGSGGRGLWDVLKWKLSSRATPWPQQVDNLLSSPPPHPVGDQIGVTWIGHSTFLLQTAAGTFLTDPIFSERASPVSWAGPKRVLPPGLAWEHLPPVDMVLLSHDHYDHCDALSLRRLAAGHPARIVAPLGHRALLQRWGWKKERVHELDWWQEISPDPRYRIALTPARHWCRRHLGDTNTRLWGGFLLEIKSTNRTVRRIYFAGDSGYDDALFSRIGQWWGAPDLALIPIGAYSPRWFMRDAHMDPAEAVTVHQEVGAHYSVAMHWGTFQLTDEGREEPVRALHSACADAGLAPNTFQALRPGESWIL